MDWRLLAGSLVMVALGSFGYGRSSPASLSAFLDQISGLLFLPQSVTFVLVPGHADYSNGEPGRMPGGGCVGVGPGADGGDVRVGGGGGVFNHE